MTLGIISRICRRLAFALAGCCIIFWMNGCSDPASYVDHSRSFSETLLKEIDRELTVQGDGRQLQLTFRQACLDCVKNDRNISSLIEKYRQANIELSGVSTHLWPRLNLGVTSEIPLSTEDGDFDLNGGVYLNYDIRRAIATGDETALKKAQADQQLLQLRLAISVLQKKLKDHLGQISLLSFKTEKKKQALNLARSALELARVYAGQEKIDASILGSWTKVISGLESELDTLGTLLKAEQFAVSDMLGKSVYQEVVITDIDKIFEEYLPAPESEFSPSGIWNNHDEARLYELELIAAEVGAQLVALERLPQIDAEIGLGDIPLEGNANKTSSLMRLSVSMPLYDFGDHSRKVALTEITRHRVKNSMSFNMTRLFNRARMARSAYTAAQAKFAQAVSAVAEGKQLIARKTLLISELRGDNFSLFQDKINLTHLEILQKEAETAVWKTADDLRYASGDDIYPESINALIDAL